MILNQFFLIAIFFLSACSQASHKVCTTPNIEGIFEHGVPSKALLEICELTGLKHDGTLTSINKAAQDKETGWIRKPGQERWNIEKKFEENRNEILKWLDQCGLVQEKKPQKQAYTYLFENGALQARMKKRINFSADLIKNSKLKIDCCVLFSGSRPTYPDQEDASFAKTEAEAMEALYKQSPLFNFITSYELVDAPMKKDDKGNDVRPTTEDPINLWLTKHQKSGSALIISDQPYLTRQTLVFKTLMPADFELDAAGAAANDDLSIATYLDELARTIYQTLKLIEAKKEC